MLTCLFMFTVSKQDKCLTQKINRSILPDNFWYNFSYRGISQTSTPYATETQTQLVLYADKLFMHKIHRGIDYWWSESFPSLQFKLITRLFRFNFKKVWIYVQKAMESNTHDQNLIVIFLPIIFILRIILIFSWDLNVAFKLILNK